MTDTTAPLRAVLRSRLGNDAGPAELDAATAESTILAQEIDKLRHRLGPADAPGCFTTLLAPP